MRRKKSAILLGPLNRAAITRATERVFCGVAFDPIFTALYGSGSKAMQERLLAETHYDELRPLWVRARPPEQAWWLGRGGRHNAHFTYEQECQAFRDLEARADAGEQLDVRAMAAILSRRCSESVSTSGVVQMLMRQGYVRVGQKPLWVRRREAIERRLGHLRRLAREDQQAANPVTNAEPDDGSASTPTPSPAPQDPPETAAAKAHVLRTECATDFA